MTFSLRILDCSVHFGQRVLLHRINIDVPERGVVAILGPGGAGKSTLLRAISGAIPYSGTLYTTGAVEYLGRPVSPPHAPWVAAQYLGLELTPVVDYIAGAMPDRSLLTRRQQRTRVVSLLGEIGIAGVEGVLDVVFADLCPAMRRFVMVARAAATDARVIAFDEPTAALEETDAEIVLRAIRRLGRSRAVLFVTHNQIHARRLAEHCALLAAGQLIEFAPTAEFFDRPKNEITAHFVRTGGCDVPSPNARPEELSDEWRERRSGAFPNTHTSTETPVAPVPAERPSAQVAAVRPETPRRARNARTAELRRSRSAGPEGFVWLLRGQLAGCPQPGIFESLERDLDRLRGAGITMLVSLTERPLPVDAVHAAGLTYAHLPVPDMAAPDRNSAMRLVRDVETRLLNGAQVAYHCHAGIGRTGTMLVAHLVGRGWRDTDALKFARQQRRDWVQSEAQLHFLRQLPVGFAVGRIVSGESDALPHTLKR